MDETRWQRAKVEHAAAVAAFVSDAEQVLVARWEEPPGDGKWSPAQVAEHVRLTYAALRRELEGEPGMRVRVGPLRRLVLRLVVLRKMLRSQRFPAGAPAVREIRPAGGPFERGITLDGLQAEATGFERALEARRNERGTRVTHPFFGGIGPLQGLELCALHTTHHRAHLGLAGAGGQAAAAGAAADTAAAG